MAADKGKFTIDMNVAPPSVNASPSGEQVKRKRGRPRKSDAAENSVVPHQGSAVSSLASMPIASLPLMRAVASMPEPQAVAHPQGSENLQLLASMGDYFSLTEFFINYKFAFFFLFFSFLFYFEYFFEGLLDLCCFPF